MDLDLIRFNRSETDTLGLFFVDGELVAFSIEDTQRDVKIPTRTRIPEGRYRIATTWSPKFGRMMPEVLNVPGFSGIRIHSGNTAEDTAGCILLGLSAVLDPVGLGRGPNRIESSRLAIAAIEPLIVDALDRGTEVWLSIARRRPQD